MTTDKNTADKGFITIPNLLSFFRLILTPLIMYVYVYLERFRLAAGIVVLSAVTDVADGFIARKFNMTSDIGKVLDPFADKVTQLVMFLCLISRYPLMKFVIIAFAIKESIQALVVYAALKKTGEVHSARWYGKASTVCLYFVCLVLMVVPRITELWSKILMYGCLIILYISLAGYIIYSLKLIFGKTN